MPAPTPEELEAYDEATFTALHEAVAAERIRREELARIPSDVDAVLQRFADAGGDMSRIKNPSLYKRRTPPTGA